MDEQRYDYGFCPKCGALMQNGKCPSCGYAKRMSQEGSSEADWRESEPRRKGMSTGVKIVLVVCVILLILLIVFVVLGVVVGYRSFSGSSNGTEDLTEGFFDFYGGDSDDDYLYDYDYDYDYEEYVPSADDDYYEEFVSSTTQGLSYSVDWHYETIYPDDELSDGYFSVEYPTLTGDDGELLEKINDELRELAFFYEDYYTDEDAYVYVTAYVTYMDEELLSVLFNYEVYGSSSSLYWLSAVNYDMSTGRTIPYSEILEEEDDGTLAQRFRSQSETQNGSISDLSAMSDEELLAYLTDDTTRVVFYTPVGVELGFNYDSGWVTVTLKDKTL
ncbi:MAG: hypothetical protein LIO67_10420 [Lachnospiraceae bacterium]|nr:hypothetical protein [Lachnospiraceae bacterium]